MEIIWSPAAKADFIDILLYLEDSFGLSVARKFRQRVMKTLVLLEKILAWVIKNLFCARKIKKYILCL